MSSNKLLASLIARRPGVAGASFRCGRAACTQAAASAQQTRRARLFLDSGVASIVANGQRAIEVGMIGGEGMTGVSVLLGNSDRVPHETFMQIAGRGRRLSAANLREAIAQSSTLHEVLLRNVHTVLAQTTETALANGRSKIEERLARWLLMAQDRIDGNELVLTHEFLSVMLGVAPKDDGVIQQAAGPLIAS